MNKKDIQTYQSAVARVRGLLARWLDAGVELFVELNKIEQSNIWKTAEHATFGDFLTAEFPNHVLSLDRYRHVIDAIAIHGIGRVRELGVESCHAMILPQLVNDPEHRREFGASIDQYLREKKAPPPPAEVRKIVRGIIREEAPLAESTRHVRRDNALSQENRRLRQELQVANRRIRELEQENAKLKKQIEAKSSKRAA